MNFTSPGFPWQHPPNLSCQWLVHTAGEYMVIVLRIKSFHLERGFDYLTIGNGILPGIDEVARLTGQVKVRTVTSGRSTMWMMLTADNTGNMMGFYLQLQEIELGNLNGM